MVEFSRQHKHGENSFSWEGQEFDVRALEHSDLWALRKEIIDNLSDIVAIIDAELDRWEPIFCAVCGEEDLSYRGKPFVTWGTRGGYVLCPRHVHAWDQKRAIAEVFG